MEKSSVVSVPGEMEEWLTSIRQKLANVSQMRLNRSIFMVPKRLRLKGSDPYKPHLVSIGPYHHEDSHLKAMEKQKWLYMKSFLSRAGYDHQEQILDDCSKAVLRFEKDIRDYYAEPISYDKFKLADMMLLDGCFMLEVLLRNSEMDPETNLNFALSSPWINDFIVETPRMVLALQRDFTLLENQIPFFVLEDLLSNIIEIRRPEDANCNLTALILQFFKSTLRFSDDELRKKCKLKGRHLLDLLHNFLIPSSEKPTNTSGRRRTRKLIPSASSLRDRGVIFSRGKVENIFEVKLDSGVVEIPPLQMDDLTCSLLMNFAALEQCLLSTTYYASSYIFLMSCLIEGPKDKKLFERKRIIKVDGMHNVKGNLGIFKEFGPVVVLKDFFYARICEELKNYAMRSMYISYPSSRLVHAFNRWKRTSYVLVILLLLVTIVQTVVIATLKIQKKGHSPPPPPLAPTTPKRI